MTVPKSASSHQTVWVDLPNGQTAAVRYVLDGDRLVCFGDERLSGFAAGDRFTAELRGLAGGALEESFWVRLQVLDGADVSLALLSDLVGDRALGRTSEEVVRSLDSMRSSRRLVALEA